MDITLTHRVDRPVDDLWAMFSDPESHLTKFAGMGHREIEILDQSSTDDSFEITIRRQVDLDVPAVAAKFVKPSNTVTSVDHWDRLGPGELACRYSVDIKGVPAESEGTATVTADGDGSRYDVKFSLKVKVPVVGERVAKALRPQLEVQLQAEFDACDAWLAAH